LRIYLSVPYTNKFKEKLAENERLDRGNIIHRSDLIYCLRKAYYRLTNVEPSDAIHVEYMVIGKTLHNIIEESFQYVEKEVLWNNEVVCTVDILENGYPIEIKTTRKTIRSPEEIPRTYIEQLQMAMLAVDKPKGYLAILNVRTADLKVWRFEWESENEKEAVNNYFLEKLRLLKKAIELKTPNLLPTLDWQCPSCEYRNICKALTGKNTIRKRRRKR